MVADLATTKVADSLALAHVKDGQDANASERLITEEYRAM